MKLLIRFAFRNLSRNLKRTILTALAMSIGLTISFWLDCTLGGRNEEVVKFITSAFSGNLQIMNKGFVEEKTISKMTDFNYTSLEKVFGNDISVTPRYYLPSLISSGESSYPIIIQGIIPEREEKVSKIISSLKEGENLSQLSTCSPGEILIGKKLAQMLNVSLGEKIVVLTQTTDGNLGNDLFRVKGIYDTGSTSFDKSYGFITENCAKELGVVDYPHEIIISLKKNEDQETYYQKIKKVIGPNDYLSTWQESVPMVARMINVNNGIMSMVSFIVLVVVILGFVNTLLMSVFERTKEIGMMLSIGFTASQVRVLFVFEAVIIGIFSSFLAIVMGSLIVLYYQKVGFDLTPWVGSDKFDAGIFSFSLIIYPIFTFYSFFKVIFLSLLIAVISVLFPAYKASRLSPLEVLRS